MKKRATVALIYGGRGYESEVSLSGRDFLLPILEKKYECLPIFIDKAGRWMLHGKRIFPAERGFVSEDGERTQVDCAIPLLHGDWGEDGIVQGTLENAGIAYVGCDTVASAVCRDKFFVKTIAARLGIPTLPCRMMQRGVQNSVSRKKQLITVFGVANAQKQEAIGAECTEASSATMFQELVQNKFDFPVFVKPCRLGSSVGARSAENEAELRTALDEAFKLCDKVIIEPCLTDKRELECGYFSAKGKEIFTYPGEVLIKGSYGYEEKYLKNDTRLAVRADIDESIADAVQEYSRRLTRALGIRDLSRVDFFLSGDRLYFNEINTFPGFTAGSLYPKMLEAAGLPIGDALDMLIEGAIARG